MATWYAKCQQTQYKWNSKLKPEDGSRLSIRIPTQEQRGIAHGKEQINSQRSTPGVAKEM